LTSSERFTHISGHPTAADQGQDREVRWQNTDILPLCYATNCDSDIPKTLVTGLTQSLMVSGNVIDLVKGNR